MAVTTRTEGAQYYVGNRTQMALGGDAGTTGQVYLAKKEFGVGEEVPIKSADGEIVLTVAIRPPEKPNLGQPSILALNFRGDLSPEHAARMKVKGKLAPSGYRVLETEIPHEKTAVYYEDPIYDLLTIDSFRGTDQTGHVVTVVAMVLRGQTLVTDQEFLEKFRRVRTL